MTDNADKKRPVAPKKGKQKRSALDKARMLAICAAVSMAVAIGAVVFAAVSVGNATGEMARYKAQTTPVVTATRAIAAGDTLGAGDVEVVDVPSTFAASGALESTADAIGKTATANIPARGQVASSNLSGEGNTTALAEALEPGRVAAAVAVSSETGVAGLIRQGDVVDVLAEGASIIEGARVLALDAQLEGDLEQYSTVTLELQAEQAGALQAAQSNGDVRLVLTALADAAAEDAADAE